MHISVDENSATLHALFPTLVYQSRPEGHHEYQGAFQEEAQRFQFQTEPGSGGKHFTGEYHGQILLHQQASLRPFFNTLAEHVSSYLQVLGMKPGGFPSEVQRTDSETSSRVRAEVGATPLPSSPSFIRGLGDG